MRLGAGRECGDLLVADVDPLDLALSSQRIGQPIQAVADDAVNPLNSGHRKGFGELVRNGLHDLAPSGGRRIASRPPSYAMRKLHFELMLIVCWAGLGFCMCAMSGCLILIQNDLFWRILVVICCSALANIVVLAAE